VGDGNTQEINVHSGNQNADVLPLLLAMRREFDRLPAEAAASARPYVEAIEAEAKKEKPDKSFLELSRNGLVEAAKACAGMAPFLLSAANEVVAWFSKHR
jgi:hypothetical protein